MGICISSQNCKELYGIDINCEILATGNETYPNQTIIGGYLKGSLPPDPDIAGIGVVTSFIAATVIALCLSAFSLFLLIQNRRYLVRLDKLGENLRFAEKLHKFRGSELCEELVLGISGTQIFTGAAYAVALRYFKGCSTTAYHYDVVAMMMILTCTTHLMSVTIVRNYWKYKTLSLLRILTCLGVFTVTGILLANQNNDFEYDRKFPAVVPDNKNYSSILLPAACFQEGNSLLLNTLHHSLSDQSNDAFLSSKPSNKSKPTGKRARFVSWLHLSTMAKRESRQQHQKRTKRSKPTPVQKQGSSRWPSPGNILFYLFCSYLFANIAVGVWTVWTAAHQIGELRMWARGSGWLIKSGQGAESAQDDMTSFGQLVPIFLNLMLLFTLVHVITSFYSKSKDRRYDIYGGIIPDEPDSGPSNGNGNMNGTAMHVVDHHNAGYKPDPAVETYTHNGGATPVSMSNLPPHLGPGIMTTTPTSAQIVQYPSNAMPPTSQAQPNPRHSSMTNLRHSSAHSVPTSPLAGGHGISPYQ
ncbi:hypothetical protein QBC37DRAFT_460398 [Rhypophila decipiens]|uniref:Uncharacterized protein n=1 Tax=Rhypophila decipiens TaxID=261697 RepID=A0AAN7B910_9PEZI|nr:hypothetical protein QBC37DRAFT_460398 [Rhypophila decipiens]